MDMKNGRSLDVSRQFSKIGVADDAAWSVVDFFSGCGGMSLGFSRRPPFRIAAAVDAEHAKPCEGFGKLACNETYEANIGIKPLSRDIAELDPRSFLAEIVREGQKPIKPGELTVFLCCPPCTDFSRAKPNNHAIDSAKNSLAVRCVNFVDVLRPEFVVMENARELIRGNHPHHYREFCRSLGGSVTKFKAKSIRFQDSACRRFGNERSSSARG